ncbi:MAG: hypothetical protein IPK83_00510 [Planctomycetes bacterium]|nr:hypothetical protein [Planctomycetota bacterium]
MKQPFRIFRRVTWTISAMGLMCAGAVKQACADDLARYAPQNTMFFLARSGNAQIDKTALDTSWGKLLAEPEMVRFRASLCRAVEQSILTLGKPDEDELKARELIYELLSGMGEFPTALIVQNIAISPAGPVFDAALICEMGDRAESFLSKIGDALEIDTTGENRVKLGQHAFVHVDGPPNGIYFGKVDQFFVASMGRQSAQAVADLIVGDEKKSLAAHEGVVSARKHFQGNEESRVISGFLNVAGIRSIVNAFVPMLAMSDPDLPNVVQSLQSVLGLDGLDSIVWESHYRDGGCVGAWFLHMPRGAAGLLGSPGKPLSDDDFKWIPRDASWAVASKFDMAGTYRKVREALKKWKSMSKMWTTPSNRSRSSLDSRSMRISCLSLAIRLFCTTLSTRAVSSFPAPLLSCRSGMAGSFENDWVN